jgi:glycosyltransferase involved in cell wall biosynthesis
VRRNSRSIARGIQKLILSQELREKLAIRARRHIEKFTWQNLAQGILKWYEKKLDCTDMPAVAETKGR